MFLKDAYNESYFMFYFISSFIPSYSWNKHSVDFLLKSNSRDEMASDRRKQPEQLIRMGAVTVTTYFPIVSMFASTLDLTHLKYYQQNYVLICLSLVLRVLLRRL